MKIWVEHGNTFWTCQIVVEWVRTCESILTLLSSFLRNLSGISGKVCNLQIWYKFNLEAKTSNQNLSSSANPRSQVISMAVWIYTDKISVMYSPCVIEWCLCLNGWRSPRTSIQANDYQSTIMIEWFWLKSSLADIEPSCGFLTRLKLPWTHSSSDRAT